MSIDHVWFIFSHEFNRTLFRLQEKVSPIP